MSKKAVLWFLLITFGLTWGVEGIMLARGVSFAKVPPIFAQYIVAGLMWVPTIGTVLVCKFILQESLRGPDARLWLGPLRPYLLILIATPVGFTIMHTFTVFMHGAFNSQGYGVWRIIVPNAHPLLGGFGGLVGLVVLAGGAWWVSRSEWNANIRSSA